MSFGGSAFGSFSSASPFGTASSSSFGGGASAFGASQPSLFGSAPAPSFGASTGVFGAPPPLFGSSDPALGASAPGFGISAPVFGSSASAFGVSNPDFGATSSAFGAPASGFGVSSSAFGAAPTPAFGGGFATGISGSLGANEPISTRAVKWTLSQLNDTGTSSSDAGRYVVISAMENFRNFSLEELRLADYQRGDTGGENPTSTFSSSVTTGTQNFGGFGTQQQQPPSQQQQQPFGGSAQLFGATTQQSSSLFGASTFGAQPSSSAFGASTPGFGASSSLFGTSAPAFGVSAPSQGMSSSLFGASASSFGTTANSFGGFSSSGFGASAAAFGATSAPSGGLFGASQPSTGFSSLGASSQSLFGASSQSLLFGGSAPAPAAAGLFSSGGATFGASSVAPAGGFGASGAQSAPSLFGNAASASAFGTSGQSSSNLFGAGAAGGAGFGAGAAGGAGFGGSGFGGSTGGAGLGGFGGGASSSSLFASSSSNMFGSSGFGSTLGASSSSLFSNFGASSHSLFGGSSFGGSQPWGTNASSASLFNFSSGSGMFGQQNVPQGQQVQPNVSDGPLLANLMDNPFGDSRLITGAAATVSQAPISGNGTVVNSTVSGQSAGALSVVVGKTTSILDMPSMASTGIDFTRRPALARKDNSNGWFVGSPMRPWGRSGSLFHVGAALRSGPSDTCRSKSRGLLKVGNGGNHVKGGNYYAPWRSENDVIKAANIRKLVIEPLSEEDLQRKEGRRREAQERDRERKKITRAHSKKSSINGMGGNDGILVDAAALITPRLASQIAKIRNDDVEIIELDNANDGHERAATASKGGENQAERVRTGRASRVHGEDYIEGSDADRGQDEREKKGEKMKIEESVSVDKGHHRDGNEMLTKEVEYRDLYRRHMSSGRRGSIGNQAYKAVSLGDADNNSNSRTDRRLPVCTKEGSYTIPSTQDLRCMTDDQLSRVESFTYGLTNIGELTWEEPVDVRGLDLDDLVRMRPGEVCVYPDEKKLPPRGQGLNKRAIVQLYGIWKLDKQSKKPVKDASATAHIVKKLKKHCDGQGLTFLGYDVSTGTWKFRAEQF